METKEKEIAIHQLDLSKKRIEYTIAILDNSTHKDKLNKVLELIDEIKEDLNK